MVAPAWCWRDQGNHVGLERSLYTAKALSWLLGNPNPSKDNKILVHIFEVYRMEPSVSDTNFNQNLANKICVKLYRHFMKHIFKSLL